MNTTYSPNFFDFHGRPWVMWEVDGTVTCSLNLLVQHGRWKSSRLDKDAPAPEFWQSNGPAIVRALHFCGAKALVMIPVTSTKVSYSWFGADPERLSGSERYRICSVTAKRSEVTKTTRVVVQLPTDDEVTFDFNDEHMKSWVKPEAAPP